MKKFVALMMVVLIMAGISANAELRYTPARIELVKIGTKHDGFVVWDEIYYVSVASDAGVTQEIEVTKEEYESIRDAQKTEPTKRAWYSNVASFCTFWNPND